jgi:hypothetical protein
MLRVMACYVSTVCVRLLGSTVILMEVAWLIKMWDDFHIDESWPLLIQYKGVCGRTYIVQRTWAKLNIG